MFIYNRTIYHILILTACFITLSVNAASIRGYVTDQSHESMIGAFVKVNPSGKGAVVGLDGSYHIKNLTEGAYTIEVLYGGYKVSSFIHEFDIRNEDEIEKPFLISNNDDVLSIDIILRHDDYTLDEVVIQSATIKGGEVEARSMERNATNTMNVVSAKAIELSPDVSVADVVQRVSGLTIERNSNGDPQYAIVRGMDKRYNYTLVNGVKIPSPDNKNRYIPLDIFPASLLERMEVHKSLTPDLEGDAIGGVINMVMKSAPEKFEVKTDFQLGYNAINLKNGFNSFETQNIRSTTPLEEYGGSFNAQADDFTRSNLVVSNSNPLPDFLGTISIGGRLFNNKLGIITAASFQNSYRGTESIWYDYSIQSDNDNLVPKLDKLQERYYSVQQQRNGFHNNIDYKFNKNHKIMLYNGYYILNDQQVREVTEYRLGGGQINPATGNASGMKEDTRTRLTEQSIFTNTLRGEHTLSTSLVADWSAVYSVAKQERPDNAQFNRVTEMQNFEINPGRVAADNPRRWERNSDQDYTAYANLTYTPEYLKQNNIRLKTGGMYRMKNRDNFFNEYAFTPTNSPALEGTDWDDYRDVAWTIINPQGTSTNALNYEAIENILAYYAMISFQVNKLETTIGTRIEHTEQGYKLKRPGSAVKPDTIQNYTDLLPSIHLKYFLKDKMNLRGGYYYGISRPSFFEIVPYRVINEEYDERGNPELRRVRAHNVDTRWEYFPNSRDQILIGAFYKKIIDPIEYALIPFGSANRISLTPGNFGTAHNWGFEFDYSRFFNKFGIKANYTYTNSTISSVKSRVVRVDSNDPTSELITINQTEKRPMQGQARHIGNFSLLYKDIKKGTEAQLGFIYTGERLESVSPFYKNDSWTRPILQVDLSVEQRILPKIQAFIRINNLINSPYKVVVKGDADPVYADYLYQENIDKYTLIRRDMYYQSFRIGFRYTFN